MYLKKISVRIGLWYSLAFLLGAVCLYFFTAYLLINSLRKKDEHLLRVKLEEYAVLYEKEGAASLRTRSTAMSIRDAQNFIVRLADARGITVFLHVPDRSGDIDAPSLGEIEARLAEDAGRSAWLRLKAGGFGDDVEVVSARLARGELLQIGKDTEDREDFLESFTFAFLGGSLPVLLMALLSGIFLSARLLAPIRTLTRTIESLRSGKSAARVPLHRTDDELRRLSQQFNALQEENERLLNGMRDTVNNVAHDLRTPLTGLLNAIEHAIANEKDLASYRAALEDCFDSAESIRLLVNAIMDVAEAEAGTLTLQKKIIDCAGIIDQAVDLYTLVAEDKGISLRRAGDPGVRVEADPRRILQAVSNLLDNALKFSARGTSVEISCRHEGAYAVITVDDEGPGISTEERLKIWERLYRGDSSRTTRGLGLGLSLVRAIALAHGGSARELARAPRGSRFELLLPLGSLTKL